MRQRPLFLEPPPYSTFLPGSKTQPPKLLLLVQVKEASKGETGKDEKEGKDRGSYHRIVVLDNHSFPVQVLWTLLQK